MNLEDRFAILDVIAAYAYAWDGQDADAWASLFTSDAVWELYAGAGERPARRFSSRDEIRGFAADSFRDRLAGVRTRHYQTNTLFSELTADAARTTTMALITQQGPADERARITLTGAYEDQWRKTDDGWMLAHRRLYGDRQ